jgi:hypothetical protein
VAPDDDQLDIAINCHVDAKPAHYDIKWLLNDTQVLSTNQNVLHIQRQRAFGKASSSSIFGKYTCLATNSISTQNKSIYLTEMSKCSPSTGPDLSNNNNKRFWIHINFKDDQTCRLALHFPRTRAQAYFNGLMDSTVAINTLATC